MTSHTIHDLANHIINRLESRYDDPITCQQYAWWMLEAITKKSKLELVTNPGINLTDQQAKTLSEWIDKQINEHVPLQYLLGSVPFFELDIIVEPPILIPRPETEEWTINLLTLLDRLNNKDLTILDLCTGSGCIALALAQALPKAHIIGGDINPQAIELAIKNAQHNLLTNVQFVVSDLFDALPAGVTYDLIVSNPPYISQREWHNLDLSVTTWESRRALIAQDNGLAIIKKIIDQAPAYLKHNAELKKLNIGQLWLEIGHQQGSVVQKLMQDAGMLQVTILDDLEKKDRVVTGRVSHEAVNEPA